MPRTPTLQQHATGVWFTHWGGERRYFSRDKAASQKSYEASLIEWATWRQQRPVAAPPRKAITVGELAVLFLREKAVECDAHSLRWYQKHLTRFVNVHKDLAAAEISKANLQALKTDMLRGVVRAGGNGSPPRLVPYAPATINHDIRACKSLFLWAYESDHLAAPPKLRLVKRVPCEPPAPKHLERAEIRCWIRCCLTGIGTIDPSAPADKQWGARSDLRTRAPMDPQAAQPELADWLELNYLTGCRPSELPRLLCHEGFFIDPRTGSQLHGLARSPVFRMATSKTSRRTQTPRYITLNTRAQELLRQLHRRYSSGGGSAGALPWAAPDAYSAAVRRLCGPGGPHPLRHSAATHLGESGVDRATVDLFLGHSASAVSRTYDPATYRPLLEIAERLAL